MHVHLTKMDKFWMTLGKGAVAFFWATGGLFTLVVAIDLVKWGMEQPWWKVQAVLLGAVWLVVFVATYLIIDGRWERKVTETAVREIRGEKSPRETFNAKKKAF